MSKELSTTVKSAASSNSLSIAPTNMRDAIDLAKMMSGSKLVPAPLQNAPADCLLVIEQALRWGMSPFAAAQSVSVISGKLMFEGKLVAAVVNANGNLEDRLAYEYEGEGDMRKITVSARIKGEKEFRHVAVVLKDAKTNNKVWSTQPDQQLMYHGARVWARRHMPELMLGVYSPEEFEAVEPRSEAPKQEQKPANQPDDGKTIDGESKPVEKKQLSEEEVSALNMLAEQSEEYVREIALCDNREKLDIAVSRFAQMMGDLSIKADKRHARILEILTAKREELEPKSPADAEKKEA